MCCHSVGCACAQRNAAAKRDLDGNRRFDFRRAAPWHEWRLHKFGVRLMPELYDSLPSMTCKEALQTAKKLADALRAKGFGVANGACTEAQSYKSILTKSKKA